MLAYLIPYVIALVVFAAIDVTWLMTVAAKMFKDTLGDVMAPEFRLGPAVLFYLLYPAGLVYFAVLPGLKDGSMNVAVLNGALFGLFTYATYELTNYATLRNWTFTITAIDIAYGLAIGAVASAITYALTPIVSRWLGA